MLDKPPVPVSDVAGIACAFIASFWNAYYGDTIWVKTFCSLFILRVLVCAINDVYLTYKHPDELIELLKESNGQATTRRA